MKKRLLKKGIFAGVMSAVLGVMLVSGNNMNVVAEEKTSSNEEINESNAALKSYISDMNIKGYVGTSIKNNIKYWQIDAYKDNPNIIDQINFAKENVKTLDAILGSDYYGVNKYFDISIQNKKLAWTLKNVPNSFADRDFRFSNDSNALVNWAGAKELWVSVDASEISTNTSLRVAFEENAIGRESYSLIQDKAITLYDENGKTESTVDANGYVKLPARFEGYVVLPLNQTYFKRYWSEGGNSALDISKVVQFQLSVKGDKEMVGKTFYINNFSIVGDVGGENLPLNIQSDYTYKTVWKFDNLTNGNGYTPSSLAWYGEFVGKLLTGMAYSYKIEPNEELLNSANVIINDLALAQGEDGYLGVFSGGARYSLESSNWDLWNQYHCITGLLEWYKITSNEKALDIAKKCLDCIYNTFKDRSYIVSGGFETNRGIAHGYAQMYQITHDKKYLDEAERIIIEDCKGDYNGWYQGALKGKHFYQTNNNRWEILHMMMTLGILYEETQNEEYYNVMAILWNDILMTDIHNTGGFTTNEGAQGSPYLEGVIETCCTIAWLAFTNEFYKYNKTVEVADEFERSYYNGLLGSLLDNDKYCTYNSPMNGIQGTCGHYDGRKVSSQQDISFQYHSESPDMNCCQANLARGLGQLSEWACLTDNDKLYLNYYGTSSIATKVNDKDVTITQQTNYPLDGAIDIKISNLTEPTKFKLMLRIPSWAKGSTAYIDGKRVILKAGTYYEIEKLWKNNDSFQLNLDIKYQYWKGLDQQANYTSVYYGPILLTLDNHFAKDFNQNAEFSVKDFENAIISKATSNGCMMFVDVKSGSETIRLVDYASAGKYNGNSSPSSYWTWLNVVDSPSASDDLLQRWKTSDKKNITFTPNVVLSRTSYYPGEVVNFQLYNPDNQEVDYVIVNSTKIKANAEGMYSFEMPSENTTISVVFKSIKNDTIIEDNNEKPLTGLYVCGAAALVAASGAVVYGAKKKKKKKEQ